VNDFGPDNDAPRSFGSGIKPEINVTPLVDIVLVLLIIFMVVAPQVESGASVELPAMSNPDKNQLEQESNPTILSLAKDGALYFDKQAVAGADLEALLRAFRVQKPDARLVLKADREAGYGKVRSLFKLCQTLGFPGVSLQVIDRQNQNSGS